MMIMMIMMMIIMMIPLYVYYHYYFGYFSCIVQTALPNFLLPSLCLPKNFLYPHISSSVPSPVVNNDRSITRNKTMIIIAMIKIVMAVMVVIMVTNK